MKNQVLLKGILLLFAITMVSAATGKMLGAQERD